MKTKEECPLWALRRKSKFLYSAYRKLKYDFLIVSVQIVPKEIILEVLDFISNAVNTVILFFSQWITYRTCTTICSQYVFVFSASIMKWCSLWNLVEKHKFSSFFKIKKCQSTACILLNIHPGNMYLCVVFQTAPEGSHSPPLSRTSLQPLKKI